MIFTKRKTWWAALITAGSGILIGAGGANAAVAVATDTTIWSGKRVVRVIAAPTSTFTLRYKRGGVVLGTQAVTMGPVNRLTVMPNVAIAKGDTVEVVGKVSSFDTFVANVLDTPTTLAIADHTLDQGTLVGGGLQFDLTGGFRVVANSFDPVTGDISGIIPDTTAAIMGVDSATGDTVQLLLDGPTPWTANLAAALAASDPTGTSASFNFGISGTMLLNGVTPLAFVGSATGTSTYDLVDVPGAHETYNVALNLNVAGVGSFQGGFQSQGVARAFVPSPASAGSMVVWGAIAALRRRRRTG